MTRRSIRDMEQPAQVHLAVSARDKCGIWTFLPSKLMIHKIIHCLPKFIFMNFNTAISIGNV